MQELTPRDIVGELDRHIIGQTRAKRAVAVAVRNRWRRRQLDRDIAREVVPKNIIMVGPTGVGKTEIARRLSQLVKAPFIKVEASKYTQVGYHGRDVESMVRDLLDLAINMVRSEQASGVREQAEQAVQRRLVSLLLGSATGGASLSPETPPGGEPADDENHVRRRMREKLEEGVFEDREIEISVREKQSGGVMGMVGANQDPGLAEMLERIMPETTRMRRVTVARARTLLLDEETEKLIDKERIVEQAIDRTEQSGIVFLDEIDKIAVAEDSRVGGADVSHQGVQRDLLPIVEGSAVSTRHGVVHTDQILFIAAGAFHSTAVSDLMPELQGRFPIRVELDALTEEDFKRILTEPDAALTRQTQVMLATEGLDVTFEPAAIDAMARMAVHANTIAENIGARRLITVMEQVFEDISYDAPDLDDKSVMITASFVEQRLASTLDDEDLSRFVL